MAAKPEYIIVPGAWHLPSAFDLTTTYLTKAGYKVHGVRLASYSASPQLQDFQPDVSIIKSKVDEVLSSGKDLVLIYHSYGSVPGSEALKDYLSDLETGGKAGWGKLTRLVYVCAFVLGEGGSLMAGLGGQDLPWFDVNEAKDTVRPINPQAIFYNDLTPEQAAPYLATLGTHAYKTFSSQQTVAPWNKIPSTYIFCEKDQAIPVQAQEGMVKAAQDASEGAFDVVERSETGHSPFLSQPEWLAGKLMEAAK